MNDFQMKYKGSELEALVEGSASSLFYAGTIEAAYSIPGNKGAQVTVSDAFRTKYGIGEDKDTFYIVDKRMTSVGDSNVLYIYPADYEGCYFVMGDFEGNDAILGLGAAKGDWVVVQGREWVKIITTFGVKAYIDEQKNMLINEYMNVKPTVRIFHSTFTNRSMVYANHPYCEQFGEGELVVMRYGKTKSPRTIQEGDTANEYYATKTGWRECLGAPRTLSAAFGDLRGERYNEPAKLSIGWSSYLDVVEEICKRATVVRELIDSEDDTEHFEGIMSMAQVLKAAPSYKNALQVLHERYYELWEMVSEEAENTKPEWSMFGGSRDHLNLGVALRVLNPEFQKLLDDGKINETNFRHRRYYYSGPGKVIPKYLYSEVCEMVMTTGSLKEMQNLDQPYCPRLTLKG